MDAGIKSQGDMDTAPTTGHNKNTTGRILRVKHGYNPNSSSIGSLVFALPAAMIGVTAGFGAVSGAIISAFVKEDKAKASAKHKKKTTKKIPDNPKGSKS